MTTETITRTVNDIITPRLQKIDDDAIQRRVFLTKFCRLPNEKDIEAVGETLEKALEDMTFIRTMLVHRTLKSDDTTLIPLASRTLFAVYSSCLAYHDTNRNDLLEWILEKYPLDTVLNVTLLAKNKIKRIYINVANRIMSSLSIIDPSIHV